MENHIENYMGTGMRGLPYSKGRKEMSCSDFFWGGVLEGVDLYPCQDSHKACDGQGGKLGVQGLRDLP